MFYFRSRRGLRKLFNNENFPNYGMYMTQSAHIIFFLHIVLSKGAVKAMEVVESSDNESIQSGEEGNDRKEERESRGDSDPVGSSQQPQVS